jgi:hypothetical protein
MAKKTKQKGQALPCAPSFVYVGKNPFASGIVWGGYSIDLQRVTDKRIKYLLDLQDMDWSRFFAPAQHDAPTTEDKADKEA